MERVKLKLAALYNAIDTLKKAIALFSQYQNKYEQNATEKNHDLFLSMRDSLIQRFEYCSDMFWKYLKLYLELVERVELEVKSPKAVVREVVKTGLVTEKDGKEFIKMLDDRNLTSHTYQEKLAEEIAQNIPNYFALMGRIVHRN